MSEVTVRTLIATLSELPPDAVVVLAKDQEGNDFSPYWAYSVGDYEPTSTWSGEFMSYDQHEDRPVNAVALWPVN